MGEKKQTNNSWTVFNWTSSRCQKPNRFTGEEKPDSVADVDVKNNDLLDNK